MLNFTKYKFEENQLWKYKTHKGDEDSRLLILCVETIKHNEIIHVAVQGKSKYIDFPEHMPFTRLAIEESVIDLCDHTFSTNYRDGYLYWRELYDKNEAGVYSVSVAEALYL